MRKILITKLASLGDLIHTLPALSDAMEAIPGIEFDWVVDKSFQEIPLWHPAVKDVIVTNHRSWRSNLFAKTSRDEFSNMLQTLKKKKYDLIIDAQGNIKSALISFLAKGDIAGWNASSVPEWGSHFFYKTSYASSKTLHSIEKLRTLFAGALNYEKPSTSPNYQIDLSKLEFPKIQKSSGYLLFVPIASYDSKLWPESYWKELIQIAIKNEYSILLPWGNQKEKERVLRLAIHPEVTVLPKVSLSEIGSLILHAEALVSVDTGLSHIAAALGTPCVTLYGPTDPNITGTIGKNQLWIKSPFTCSSHCKQNCHFDSKSPVCLKQIHPESAWENLKNLLLSSTQIPL